MMRSRFIIAFSLLILGIGYWAYDESASSLEVRYREVVEELLVDQVQLLASGLSADWDVESYAQAVDASQARVFEAKIYDLVKRKAKLKSYITDARGRVLYHSISDTLVGADYSRWRDVYLTLKGEYGARSSREVQSDERSSVLWVAAPIIKEGQIVGVISLGKSVADWTTLLNSAIWSVQKGTLGFVTLGILLSLVLSLWVFNPLRKLNVFVDRVDGPDAHGKDEISRVESVLSSLSKDLEAKQYVENYVQILTHELKSPISAILGSTEILEGAPESDVQTKFTRNIGSEARRMQILVETILKVSQLELENQIEKKPVLISSLIEQVQEALAHPLFEAQVSLEVQDESQLLQSQIQVDQMLIIQALVNIILNAIQYSPEGAQVVLTLSSQEGRVLWSVRDQGPGIPDYALLQIFNKFYSLKKPRTGQKGTGLGLPFVQEVMRLHQGEVSVQNHPKGGVEVRLKF